MVAESRIVAVSTEATGGFDHVPVAQERGVSNDYSATVFGKWPPTHKNLAPRRREW